MTDNAAQEPVAEAPRREPENVVASTQPAPEQKQDTVQAAKPDVGPVEESEKETTKDARRAKRSDAAKGEVEIELVSQTGLKREEEEKEAEREAPSADSNRPLPRTARAATTRAAREGNSGKVAAGQQELETAQAAERGERAKPGPREDRLRRAKTFNGDLRALPSRRPLRRRDRPEREEPLPRPTIRLGVAPASDAPAASAPAEMVGPSAPAPAPSSSFDGLDYQNWGSGHPPDTVGDVGPTYYIQSINSSVGIYRKSDGVRVAAFTLDTLMSQGQFGNLCDTDNFGDPVVLYDTFEDRWVITDFAFQLSGGNVVNPPGAFQCFAVSKTGDPVAGGWNFYSINTVGGLGDYPKFGIWPDGLYMTTSMFGYAANASFQNPRVYAFNKAQMYAGAPTVQVVSFNAPSDDFTILPSNARLQTGTPPAGSPNYYVSSWNFLNALSVYKFHVNWDRIALSTFTGPDVPLAATSWPNASVPNAPSQGGNSLDVLQIRAMMQNQYTNLGGVESLWNTHTVRRANTTGFAAPRWYQLNVNNGTVAANIAQAVTWDPDGANVIYRFMPSLAVNRMGDMALGYSTSSSTTKPAIKYAGRLATDPINTFSQTEQVLIQGTGTQTGNCGGPCTRWGDYAAMTLDPDGCTFWFTSEYYATDGLNHQTRIGSFSFPGCTPVGAGGTVSGTVTDGTNPIGGATVALGSRTATTDASGVYSFTDIPAGTYPTLTASSTGFSSSTASNVVVADAATTTQNFTLSAAPTSACPVDTTQSDFQTGLPTNTELTTSPGDVKLANSAVETADQVSSPAALSISNNLTATSWTGQTFRAGITGNLSKITVGLGLASGTSGTVTVEIRDLNGSNPGTNVLATGTLGPVTNVGTAALYTTTFATPAAVVSGTSYSVVLRNSVGNTVFGVRGSTTGGSSLANGQVFTTTTSGASWTPIAADMLFTTFVTPPFGYYTSGDFVSNAKDANPAAGLVINWTTLSWTANVPANTSLSFQIAASNSVNGPFNFVGPDGTAGTFFTTSGASLAQFKGFRYLKYKALLATSDTNITPTLGDVTVCFVNKQTQTINFGTLGNKTFGDADFQVSATATSNLPVSFAATGDCTVTGDSVHLTGPGSCTITASQGGDGTYEPASSVDQTFQIAKAVTTTGLTSNINPSNTGQQVTFTATVSESLAAADATGTVNFVDTSNANAVLCGSVSLTAGQAQCQTSTLTAGTHAIQAVYSGDDTFATSTSSTVQQAINPVLRVLDAKVAEPSTGTSQMLFTVVLTAPAGAGGVTVNYATADDTGGSSPATAGTDYTQVTATQLNFATGETVKVVSVPVLHDANAVETDETLLLVLSSATGATIGRATATGVITQAETPGTLIISELRTRGPAGDGDEFVELYNNGNTPLTVNDTSGGYGLYKLGSGCNAAPVLVGTVPNGTVIPARGHYLLVGSAYSLGSYAAGDTTLTSDIEDDRSVALFSTANVSDVSSANRLDAVGFVQGVSATATTSNAETTLQKFRGRISILSNSGGMCDLLKEGTALPSVTGTVSQHSFFRKECDFVGGVGCTANGNPKDTGDNTADFTFADTQGTFISGVAQKLGAPGPEGLASPIRRDTSGIGLVLLDGSLPSQAVPNRSRSFSTGDNATFGTLTIRRRVVNNTGQPVTRLRFRIVEMTTFPSPGGGQADLRALSSVAASVNPINDAVTCTTSGAGSTPCTVTVQGTTLEEPPGQSNGGGVNSTLSAGTITTGTPLANGASLNVQFVLGIQTTGTFRFYIIVEALP